ncbi:MAG TPA: DNA translocase FtsK 4TM domain-containing protein, partial [Candidatus Saccharimonadales bacterium]|nr:DNA translocase FtsK 4TM domain-containing protein [Candidatus Saccharimonadales bacterium]
MAKKKQTRRKAAPEPAERSPFWPLTGAVLLFVLALFLLLGGFGTGGNLPKGLFNATYTTVGAAAYLLPVALVYWGIYKFKDEEHRIPLAKLISMLGVLVFASGWLFTAFATKQATGEYANGHGGAVGSFLGGSALTALDKFPASIMFLVFVLLASFFAFDMSLTLLKDWA